MENNETNMGTATTPTPSQNKKMTKCKACGAEMAKSAKSCPACGAKNKKPIYLRPWFIILALIIIIALASALSGGGDTKSPKVEAGKISESNNTTGTNEATDYSINVGETYKDEVYCDITFAALDENYTGYSSYSTIPNGFKVIKATFDFKNNSKDDFLASAYDFDCYADDESCEEFFGTDDSGFSDVLSAGKKASGKNVYFLVPKNAEKIILEYELNFWSDRRIEFVVK